jgi:hypothetical protein
MGVNRKNADTDRESIDTNEEKKASSDEVMRGKPKKRGLRPMPSSPIS